MADTKLETRLGYLEKVVDDLLINRKVMSDEVKDKDVKGGAKTPPSAPDPNQNPGIPPVETITPSDDDAGFELVYPRFDVRDPKSGKMVMIDRSALIADTALLAWMRDKHADCFKS